MDQKLVIETLTNIARLMELAGENVFKTRAFANGARALRKLEEKEFKDLVKEGKLREIPGIGAGLEEAILAILETGTTTDYEKMKDKIPAGL
ncbi:MAG TPA: histidinol-phosphatase, partial [Firmicutes bacterium]|nr:histidinol-phosphatase [Candidatus Fermentithermobacillaceae bacterium]